MDEERRGIPVAPITPGENAWRYVPDYRPLTDDEKRAIIDFFGTESGRKFVESGFFSAPAATDLPDDCEAANTVPQDFYREFPHPGERRIEPVDQPLSQSTRILVLACLLCSSGLMGFLLWEVFITYVGNQ